MPLDPAFVADCPYGPEGVFIDEIVSVDREASRVVASMPTHADLPITRTQRVHPEKHPQHVSGGLMVHVSGIMGFAHAYHVLDLRHADGWSGFGTHVHSLRFKKLARIGPKLTLAAVASQVRKIGGAMVIRYQFKFEQDGEVVYEGDQTAMFSRLGQR